MDTLFDRLSQLGRLKYIGDAKPLATKVLKTKDRGFILMLVEIGIEKVFQEEQARLRQEVKERLERMDQCISEEDGLIHYAKKTYTPDEYARHCGYKDQADFQKSLKKKQQLEKKYTEKLRKEFSEIPLYEDSILHKWKMDNGDTLGECTASHIRKCAKIAKASAEGQLKNAAFYDAIAGDLDDEAIIREHVKIEYAESKRKEIFG